jgi:hypothetical protein
LSQRKQAAEFQPGEIKNCPTLRDSPDNSPFRSFHAFLGVKFQFFEQSMMLDGANHLSDPASIPLSPLLWMNVE